MVEIERETVEFPVLNLVANGVNIKWQHFIFVDLIIYIVQLYNGNCTILQIRWAVRLYLSQLLYELVNFTIDMQHKYSYPIHRQTQTWVTTLAS